MLVKSTFEAGKSRIWTIGQELMNRYGFYQENDPFGFPNDYWVVHLTKVSNNAARMNDNLCS